MKKLFPTISVRLSLWLFSPVVLFFLIIIRNEKIITSLCREDGQVEWLQAVLLLTCSVLCFYMFVKYISRGSRLRWFFLALTFFFLWLFFEEISYGQRIFNFNSPYYFAIKNVHREVNVHNLEYFDSASEIFILSIIILWGIILPLFLSIKTYGIKFLIWESDFLPDTYVSLCCLAGLLIEFYCRKSFPEYWANSNEILELFLYLAFFSVILKNAVKLKLKHSFMNIIYKEKKQNREE